MTTNSGSNRGPSELRVYNRPDGDDEGVAAMTAHSILSPQQRADLEMARKRARKEAELRHHQQVSVHATPGDDQTALDMEPASLVAAIQGRRS